MKLKLDLQTFASNKVEYGLEQVHIAFFDTEAEDQPAWETPIAIPGAVRWTPTVAGDTNTFYADNMAYFVSTANNGYTAELEMALVSNEIKARMLGWLIDINGALIEVTDGAPEKFALLFQVQGDQRNKRFVHYDCQAARPAKEHSTKTETITPSTDVLSVTISPALINGHTVAKGELELSDTNATVYSSFFESVYLPTYTPGGGGGA